MDRKRLGDKGELLACEFIKNKGLQIIERNFKCRTGEIDIIAKDDNYIVIIEVRSVANYLFHDPLDSFTPLKIRKLKRLALIWLDYRNRQDAFIRFDIITIVFNVRNNINVNYIKDAF